VAPNDCVRTRSRSFGGDSARWKLAWILSELPMSAKLHLRPIRRPALRLPSRRLVPVAIVSRMLWGEHAVCSNLKFEANFPKLGARKIEIGVVIPLPHVG